MKDTGNIVPIKGHDCTLSTLVKTCGLVDPLLIHHPEYPPPPTYDRGTEKIDFLFVSSGLLGSPIGILTGVLKTIIGFFLFPPVYFPMLRGLAFFLTTQYLRATIGHAISISIVRHFFEKIHPSLVHRSTEASDYRIQAL
jgi:hypothetical protein